jgi:multidrug efflux pump subunit AcrB
MRTLDDLREVPVAQNQAPPPLLGDLAHIENGTIGEVGAPPRGTTVSVRGQIASMRETLLNIGVGLVVAVAVIFLLLAANFQSLRLAFVVVSTVPAVLSGVVVMLLVTFAEQTRPRAGSALEAAIDAARARMRPVLMTSAAMIAGMIPMALAFGEGAEATAPLGRAVIGGLAAATIATLIVLPSIYSLVQPSAATTSPSLDPDDPLSAHHSVKGTAAGYYHRFAR